jgi:Protein of unknown function (DUF1073)
MAGIELAAPSDGSALTQIMKADDIQPGDDSSYQMCKTIYLYHPLGARVAENPISMAQSQPREIKVRSEPADDVKDQFLAEWESLGADKIIHNAKTISRVYGVSTLALLIEGVPPNRPVDYKNLKDLRIEFNVLDPLNTSGSLTMDQDPNSMRFQRPLSDTVSVAGQKYHPSRTVVTMNEQPIYIAWTSSAFGYVGRSSYQRALYPLKSYIDTLRMDAMIAKKAGVIIAKLKVIGPIVNNIMATMGAIKRNLLREASTDNVISIAVDEDVESMNLQNLEGPAEMARSHILENIASAADMPAKLLNSLPFAGGFAEGKEDAKAVAKYIDGVRKDMNPLYEFMDRICMYKAWTPEFYETQKTKYPETYGNTTFIKAFYDWKNTFVATWPSLLVEPESEKIKISDTKLKAIIAIIQVLLPVIDPENRMLLIKWAVDAFAEDTKMFSNTIEFNWEALKNYVPPEAMAVMSGKQGVEQGENAGGSKAGGSGGKGPAGPAAPPVEKGPQGTPGRAKVKLSTADALSVFNNLVELKRVENAD